MNLGKEHDKWVLSLILKLQKFWEELISYINITFFLPNVNMYRAHIEFI